MPLYKLECEACKYSEEEFAHPGSKLAGASAGNPADTKCPKCGGNMVKRPSVAWGRV